MSTGTFVPKQARSQRRQEALLDAVEKLLADRRADQIGVAEVAALANVSVASVYTRFLDKDAMILAVIERFEPRRVEELEEAFGGNWDGMTLRERCERVAFETVSYFRRNRGVLRAMLEYFREHPEAVSPQREEEATLGYRLAGRRLAEALIKVTPGTERVAQAAFFTATCVCRDQIVFGPHSSLGTREMDDTALAVHLAHTMYASLVTP